MQTVEMVREKQLNIRLSEAESARLEWLAEHYGTTVAMVVRMLAKRDADALGYAAPVKGTKKSAGK